MPHYTACTTYPASDAEQMIRQHEPDIMTVVMIIILYLRGKVYVSVKHN